MDPRLQQAKREKAKKHKELFDRAYNRVKSQLAKNLKKDKPVTDMAEVPSIMKKNILDRPSYFSRCVCEPIHLH